MVRRETTSAARRSRGRTRRISKGSPVVNKTAAKILPKDKSLKFATLLGKKRVSEKGSDSSKPLTLKADIRNQTQPLSSPKGNYSTAAAITTRDFAGMVTMTAQQYAQQEGAKYAQWAATLVRDTINDMSMVLGVLREAIPFTEAGKMRPIMESYQAATSEMRKALGLVEDAQTTGPRTLVQIQCVGDVTVSGPTQDAAPTAELPDFE